MPRKTRLNITIQSALRRAWRGAPLLRRVALHVCAAERFKAGELSIAVVGARRMATLHQRHSNIPGPTDVLTFDLGCERRAGRIDAEIVVCADVAARRVKGRGASAAALNRELALYVTHGILHLAGYDDHTPAGYARMHAREDALLEQLGLGRVFSAEPAE